MTDGEDDYVHDPTEFRRNDGDAPDDDAPDDDSRGTRRTFGWRGWVLVGWLVIAFVVVPTYLFFFPRATDALGLVGLGYRETYLVLPLVPAVVLGILAVWATTRP